MSTDIENIADDIGLFNNKIIFLKIIIINL